MKPKYAHLILTAALLSLLMNALHARLVVQHIGADDPQVQGFVLMPPGNGEVGPVHGDSGKDAWLVHTRSGNEGAIYSHRLTSQEQADAATHGWILSATMRLVDLPDDGGTLLRFYSGSEIFRLSFSADSEDTVFIGGSGSGYRLEGSDGGYHQYDLVYDPIAEVAALWIDGVESVSEWYGWPTIPHESEVWFGASQAVTRSHWHEVSFTIIPEPVTVVLFSGIGALLVAGAVRWRRRSTRNS